MEKFKIRQNGFNEIRRGMLIKSVPIILLAALAGIAISHFSLSGQEREVNVYPFIIPIILLALGFGFYQGIKRQKEIFESYRLIIDNNSITREQWNMQTISISITDISEIRKNSNGSLTIKGNSTADIIVIPAQIDNFEKLEKLLSEIRHISEKDNKPFLQKYIGLFFILLPITIVGLMAIIYLCENKIIISICGTLLLGILAFSFFEIHRNKNIDSKTKKGSWWLILVVASIILTLVYKIFG